MTEVFGNFLRADYLEARSELGPILSDLVKFKKKKKKSLDRNFLFLDRVFTRSRGKKKKRKG